MFAPGRLFQHNTTMQTRLGAYSRMEHLKGTSDEYRLPMKWEQPNTIESCISMMNLNRHRSILYQPESGREQNSGETERERECGGASVGTKQHRRRSAGTHLQWQTVVGICDQLARMLRNQVNGFSHGWSVLLFRIFGSTTVEMCSYPT